MSALTREIFRCDGCPATYAHANETVDAETLEVQEDCPTTDGICAHLHAVGWRMVWVRVTKDSNLRLLFGRGGWLCKECVARYLPARKKKRHGST
jgi:hypothetical protein